MKEETWGSVFYKNIFSGVELIESAAKICR